MSTRNIVLISILAFILLLGGCGCSGYNGLVQKDQNVKSKWSTVESNYQRRLDLFSNLVDAAEAAADFEKSTLKEVIEARASATKITLKADELSTDKIAAFQKAQGELSSSIGRLLVSVEQYPQLKATDAFRQLQTEVEGTENRINTARKDFNDAVQDYNVSIKQFPMVIFAGMFGFKEKDFFMADSEAKKAPRIRKIIDQK